jgi:ATP-dependent exoDNAse (exonuclease V) alpha subunit
LDSSQLMFFVPQSKIAKKEPANLEEELAAKKSEEELAAKKSEEELAAKKSEEELALELKIPSFSEWRERASPSVWDNMLSIGQPGDLKKSKQTVQEQLAVLHCFYEQEVTANGARKVLITSLFLFAIFLTPHCIPRLE